MSPFGQPEPCVAVAGDGIAAAALACRLLGRGFGVVVLARHGARLRSSPPAPIIEALPEATLRLLDEVGLEPALAAAGAVVVDGFENGYDPAGHRLEGAWAHVDRSRLARACLTLARRRGATLVPVRSIGAPAAGPIRVAVDGREIRVLAVVDATGRAARWSRPVGRAGSAVATLYTGPGQGWARPGRIVRTAGGWAYRLDHPDGTTVGVVSRLPTPGPLYADLADGLGVDDPASFTRVGARPASVQWATECLGEGRLAVGDAALAYSPLAGQGVRFAVASALAAAAVLESWRDGDTAVADDYYRRFVEGARQRHLAKLAALDGEAAPGARAPAGLLRFAAVVRPAGLSVDGRIVTDDACVLADGGMARWVGGFDLLQLRALVGDGATAADVLAGLAERGTSEQAAAGLLSWAVRTGVLVEDVVAATARGPGGHLPRVGR